MRISRLFALVAILASVTGCGIKRLDVRPIWEAPPSPPSRLGNIYYDEFKNEKCVAVDRNKKKRNLVVTFKVCK